jgi:hypothetical protein
MCHTLGTCQCLCHVYTYSQTIIFYSPPGIQEYSVPRSRILMWTFGIRGFSLWIHSSLGWLSSDVSVRPSQEHSAIPVFFHPAKEVNRLESKVSQAKMITGQQNQFLAVMSSHVNLIPDWHLSLTVTKTGSVRLNFHYESLGGSWQRRSDCWTTWE